MTKLKRTGLLAFALAAIALAVPAQASAVHFTIDAPANGSVVNSVPALGAVPPVTFDVGYSWVGTPSCDYTGTPLVPGALACDNMALERPTVDGTYTLAMTGTVTNGTPVGDSDSSTFILDTADPVASISSPADGVQTNNRRPTFTFSATDANPLTYTCNINGTTVNIAIACGSPTSFTPSVDLPDDTYSFNVTASDGANSGGATIFFTVDTAAPTVNVAYPTPGAVVDSSVPEVKIDVVGATAGSTCRFDANEFQACSGDSWLGSSLSDGSHTLTVRGVDLAGNVSEVIVQFFVDDSLSSGPAPQQVSVTNSKGTKVKRGKFSVKVGLAILPRDVEYLDRACTGSATVAIKPSGGKSYSSRIKLKRSGDRCKASGKVTLPKKFKGKRAKLSVRYHGSMLISSFTRTKSIKKL